MTDVMREGRPHTIVVIANETAASRSLVDLIQDKAKGEDDTEEGAKPKRKSRSKSAEAEAEE